MLSPHPQGHRIASARTCVPSPSTYSLPGASSVGSVSISTQIRACLLLNHCLSASVRLRHCNFLLPSRSRRFCTARPTQSSSHTGSLAYSSQSLYDRGFLHAFHHPGKASGTIGMREKAIGRADTMGPPKRPSCHPARTMNCKIGLVSNESAETAYGEE